MTIATPRNRDQYVSTMPQPRGMNRTMFTHQSHQSIIAVPNNVLDRASRQLCNHLLLLNVEQGDSCCRRQDDASRSTVKEINHKCRTFDRLGNNIIEISNLNHLIVPIENGKSVTSDEYSRRPRATLSFYG